jgi:hypothetical protein
MSRVAILSVALTAQCFVGKRPALTLLRTYSMIAPVEASSSAMGYRLKSFETSERSGECVDVLAYEPSRGSVRGQRDWWAIRCE